MKRALSRVTNMIEQIFGPPMAAPESPAMRRLRYLFIIAATVSGLSIAAIDLVVALIGRVLAGGIMFVLICVAAIIGFVFFRKKNRNDDDWLLSMTGENGEAL